MTRAMTRGFNASRSAPLNHQGCIDAWRLGSALLRSRLLSCLRRTARPGERPSLGVPLMMLPSRFAPARDLPHMAHDELDDTRPASKSRSEREGASIIFVDRIERRAPSVPTKLNAGCRSIDQERDGWTADHGGRHYRLDHVHPATPR